MNSTLSVRKTNKYVGTYDYLDEWEDIGTMQQIGYEVHKDEEDDDYCEPMSQTYYLLITTEEGVTTEQIVNALHDTFTKAGCHHEYDCCGCRSYYTHDVENTTGNLWKVVVGSSRNY